MSCIGAGMPRSLPRPKIYEMRKHLLCAIKQLPRRHSIVVYKVVTGGAITTALTDLVQQALSVKF